jgi:hypothetical protein
MMRCPERGAEAKGIVFGKTKDVTPYAVAELSITT